MATTALYARSRSKSWAGDIDLINDRIVAALLDITSYTVDIADDEFLSDLPSGVVVATQVLTGKTLGVAGDFYADDSVFPAVATGTAIGAILLYKDTGFAADSRLLYYDDQATNLPAVGDDSDVTVSWPDPIFQIGT